MKQLLALFAIGILFFACSENTNLVDPQHSTNATITSQKTSTFRWISTPSTKGSKFIGLDQAEGEQVVDLTIGGDVTANFVSVDGLKTISATLHVPAGALKDTPSLRFHMLVDNNTLSIQFLPHPTIFDIPLTMDLEYTGVDLTGIDPATVYFAYLDTDMTSWVIPNEYIFTDVSTGTLRITGGEIPHFSEYGFVRKENTEGDEPKSDGGN